MTVEISRTTEQRTVAPRRKPTITTALAGALFGFGLTLLIIAGAYVRDLAILQNAPQAVWQFVCGIPTDDAMAFPLLIGFGFIAILSGGGLLLVQWLRRARQSR
jgi:hypothetical protein